MFIPKGNGKYTSKAIPLTEAEYNSITINNVFNKEQYAEQAVNNAEQAAQAISLNELISQALQAQSTPETAENGVAETSSNTEDVVTNNAVENQVSYPTKKDGGIDYDNLTPEQEYSLTAQEYGEDVAQEDVKSYIEQYQSAIDNIQSQLDSKNGTNSRAKMREAMRKNQEKLDAWKALLKEETAEQTIEQVAEQELPKDVNQSKDNFEMASDGENAPGNGGVLLSDEVDDNGRQFVLNSNGSIVFGEIGEDSGLTPAPILLSEGLITNPATNDGYGLVHIEARHGDQIRNAGYKNVVEFVEEVAKNYEVIREGKERNGLHTYMLQLTDKHNNTLMVELSGDGTYWNINTAGIFKTSYGKNRKEVYNRHTTAKQPTETVEASQDTEQSGTQATSSMNAPTTSSVSEDTNIVPEKQEKVVESDENNNQTPEEVVQQAAIDTTEKRKEDALASFSESGAYTEALGAATEDTARKAEAFFKVIEEYGVRLTTKAPSINGNYIQFVQGRIGKLSEEQQAEVMEAVVAYKRAYMDQLVIEKFNSELANITDSKIHEEQTNSANEAIRNVKAANDNMLNDMVAKGDFSNEHMLITSHKDTEKSDVHTLEKPLLKERNNAMDDYQKRYDEVVNLNKTEERAKKRAENKAERGSGDIKRKKVWIKNREGEIVEVWVKGDEAFESPGAYTIFRNETGKERYTPRKRNGIFKDENGSDSYAPVVKQGESEIENRTIRIKRDVKTSDVSKNIVDLIGKIKTGDVGSVSELKDIIKSLKSKIVTLCKKINESDFSDEVKVYLLDELDSAYFFSEQAEIDGVQKSSTPTKGKVADAILKIRTTPQQRGGNRTYVDKKGNVKERKNETFETIEDLLGANNEVVEIISDKLNNVHEIIEESESSLRVETPLYSDGTMSNSNPISLNEALKGIANLVRGFNLQGRIVVAMNLDQLKKINEKAYEAELNGEEVRGFYLPSKHQIVLYVPNLLSKGSVENVIFHEGIAHFGLRELLGEEEFNNFCKQVWKSMSYADKKAMMEYIGKEYVYNQKVSEGDMIAAAEEYVAHLAETPMFAEYLRNRNEQEAVSWIAKKWKKVCNLIRKIFKKRTGEELLSSDENIMDALYRSYQLLGSDDYAMFDYYRSLTEQMRKEDVKVGEINEEEIFSKENSNTIEQELQSVKERNIGTYDGTNNDIRFRKGEQIKDMFDKAIAGDLTGKPISIGRLTDEGKTYLENISGLQLKDDIDFVLNPSDLVHIYKNHYGDNEKDKGNNIPLTRYDIGRMIDVVSFPTKILYGEDKEGRKSFYFLMEDFSGAYNLLEIYADKKGNLSSKTYYKTRKGVSQRVMNIENSLHSTPKTDEATLSDAKIPQMFENPSIESENSSSTQEQGTILFSKGKPAGYVNLSSEMFKGKRNVLSLLEAKDAAILNASKKWFESVLGEGNLVTDNYVSRDVYMPKR